MRELDMREAEENEEVYRLASAAFSGENPAADVIIQENMETVFGRGATWRDVRSRIRKLPMRPLLAILSLMGVQVEHARHPIDAVLQLRLTQKLADDSRRSRGLLRRLREEPPRAVVDQEQLAILARVAITYAEAEMWPADGNMLLLEAMLAFNSLRSADIESRSDSQIARLLFLEVRASVNDVGNKADILSRYGAFASWARTEDARSSRSFLDLDDLFQQALTMPYLDFAGAMMAFYSNFGASLIGPDGRRSNYPFLETEAFLQSVERPETLRRWLSLVSVEISEARTRLGEAPLSTSIASLGQFMATPLLTDGAAICCPALRYLPNVAGDGLLFRLGQFLERTQNRKASDRLRGFYADFLEEYVTQLLQRATRSRSCRIFREKTFGRSEERTSDIVIFDGPEAIFVDVNSKRFNMTHSVLNLELESIKRDLEKMIVSKVEKIAKRAREFRAGRFAYEGIRADTIQRITGLVITPQGLSRVVGITNELNELLAATPEGLSQWEFFDLSEAEVLPRIFDGNLNIAELVERKQSDEAGRRRSLTNYLWFRERDVLHDRRTDEERLGDPWFREVLARIQSWGLRADYQLSVES